LKKFWLVVASSAGYLKGLLTNGTEKIYL